MTIRVGVTNFNLKVLSIYTVYMRRVVYILTTIILGTCVQMTGM